MMHTFTVVLLLTCYCASVYSSFPSDIEKCKMTDPNLNECMREQAEKVLHKYAKSGLKDIGLIMVDPLEITELSATGGGSANLDQTYKNMKIYGMSSTYVEKFDIDFDKCEIEAIGGSDVINVLADYTLKGQLLVFPINSQGKSNFTLKNSKMKHNLKCEKIMIGGNEHLNITDFKTEFIQYDIELYFDNLLAGNTDISNGIANVLKENSNEIFTEVKPSHEEAYAILFKRIFNNVFKKVPLKELFA
ncbi:PREDICTED: uncharacterized protein LOC108568269 [Nicrophorus vespilloides]|uniref:Uncharacterized protein LOC108568269 n=1 Tax=Nicrophorus vespilloides TaxID=110193 RepID=A0ABM1ND35_NICVS|nr:PREDICTED: uncharacterized protein LOC108568269 [Nicrophorus vespilloides]